MAFRPFPSHASIMNSARSAKASPVKLILAASVGNALEWYDLAVYGFFAQVLSKQFFPVHDETLSLMLTLGTFAISYIIRPVGALVLGSLADRKGRKTSLLWSIVLMFIGTALIAVMPPYAAIGIWAPLGILASRLIQGFSVGGEFGSATALLVEHAPSRRGFMSSWQYASQGLTTLLAAGMGALLTSVLTPEQLGSWGWRIPFVFGLLIAPVGLFIRRNLEEGAEFRQNQASRPAGSPLGEILHTQKLRVLLAVGVLIISTAINYMILYMPTYGINQLHLSSSVSFTATMLTGFLLVIIPPFIGTISDRIGRVRIMLPAAIVIGLAAVPLFMFLDHGRTLLVMLLFMTLLGVLKAVYVGGLAAMLSEAFPVNTRASGMALSYNIGTTIFGGFTPLTVTWLIHHTGSNIAPGYYLLACAAISVLCLWGIRSRLAD